MALSSDLLGAHLEQKEEGDRREAAGESSLVGTGLCRMTGVNEEGPGERAAKAMCMEG